MSATFLKSLMLMMEEKIAYSSVFAQVFLTKGTSSLCTHDLCHVCDGFMMNLSCLNLTNHFTFRFTLYNLQRDALQQNAFGDHLVSNQISTYVRKKVGKQINQ